MSSTCSLISSTSRYQMTAGVIRGSPEAVEQLADEVVEGLVLVQAVPDPLIELVRPLRVGRVPLFVPQHQVPLVREIVRVRGAGRAGGRPAWRAWPDLCRRRKAVTSRGRRRRSRDVDRNAAEERGVVSQRRRRHAQHLQLAENRAVDEVLLPAAACRRRLPAARSRGTWRPVPGSEP